ncbi:MAG: hypothetical protein V4537_16485 [Pseudomonadota bacterium]
MPASPTADLPRPLAVVAHDAGAANLIVAWLDPADPPRSVMRGPAEAIWRARMGDAPLADSIAEAIDGAATMLSGTGWASDLEHEARIAARAAGIRSIAVLDHWVNYRPRFERGGTTVLPDALWVTDEDAATIARDAFDLPVALQPNPYLAAQVAAIRAPRDPAAALYVLEPARSDWGRGTPGEFQALDHFMANRGRLGMRPHDPVRLRPHPSDPPGKYDAWIARNPPATIDQSASLGDAIDGAGIVVGAETHAMVVALAAGRRVVCALPPWAPPCRLPQAGIEHLTDRSKA